MKLKNRLLISLLLISQVNNQASAEEKIDKPLTQKQLNMAYQAFVKNTMPYSPQLQIAWLQDLRKEGHNMWADSFERRTEIMPKHKWETQYYEQFNFRRNLEIQGQNRTLTPAEQLELAYENYLLNNLETPKIEILSKAEWLNRYNQQLKAKNRLETLEQHRKLTPAEQQALAFENYLLNNSESSEQILNEAEWVKGYNQQLKAKNRLEALEQHRKLTPAEQQALAFENYLLNNSESSEQILNEAEWVKNGKPQS